MKNMTLKEFVKKEFKTKEDKALLKQELKLARISLRITELRKKRRLSQKQLARLLHTKQQYISRIEQPGNVNITLNTLYKIADVFHKELHVDFV